MNRHLTDDEISAAVAGLPLDETAGSHLGSCLSCRAAVRELRDVVQRRRDDMLAGCPDWDAQRRSILERLPASSVPTPLHRRRWLPDRSLP